MDEKRRGGRLTTQRKTLSCFVCSVLTYCVHPNDEQVSLEPVVSKQVPEWYNWSLEEVVCCWSHLLLVETRDKKKINKNEKEGSVVCVWMAPKSTTICQNSEGSPCITSFYILVSTHFHISILGRRRRMTKWIFTRLYVWKWEKKRCRRRQGWSPDSQARRRNPISGDEFIDSLLTRIKRSNVLSATLLILTPCYLK